jgi:hypothetical protein
MLFIAGAVNKLLTKPSYFTKGLYMIQIGVDDFIVQVLLSGHTLEQIQANLTRHVPAALLAGVEVIIFMIQHSEFTTCRSKLRACMIKSLFSHFEITFKTI